ncbi:MAG: transcription repressor NadR [Caldicoprobacterales bacterium]|nr:transcription repressor NadR [Clostridiales bacterium]
MTAEQRRKSIVDAITRSSEPLTGAYLAGKYQVTRQVIVQDIAILRAAGYDIIATPRGYIIPLSNQPKKFTRVFAVKHNHEGMEEELYAIVDCGGRVLDVIIEHPVYGEFKASLLLSTRRDVDLFIETMKKEEAEPLSALTEGVHLHTIEADSHEILNEIEEILKQRGYLLN